MSNSLDQFALALSSPASGGGYTIDSELFQKQKGNPSAVLTGDRFNSFQSALKVAGKAFSDKKQGKKCDEALKDVGISSLAALVAKMNTSNVFDGKKSTAQMRVGNKTISVREFLASRQDVPAFNLGDVKSNNNNVYLNSVFYEPNLAGNVLFPDSFRAVILIHEVVHQFGGKNDSDFDSSAGRGDGSTKLSERICGSMLSRAECRRILRAIDSIVSISKLVGLCEESHVHFGE